MFQSPHWIGHVSERWGVDGRRPSAGRLVASSGDAAGREALKRKKKKKKKKKKEEGTTLSITTTNQHNNAAIRAANRQLYNTRTPATVRSPLALAQRQPGLASQ